jgi:hypothetical protein
MPDVTSNEDDLINICPRAMHCYHKMPSDDPTIHVRYMLPLWRAAWQPA